MVDYSKWQNIEISDDEDDIHSNIDTPSFYRWRHKTRIERMEEHKKEVEVFEVKKAEHEKKYLQVKQSLLEAEKSQAQNLPELQKAFKELEKENNNIEHIAEELKKKEKKTPWNIDTISKPGFARTVINTKPLKSKDKNLTEEEKESKMKTFTKEYEKELKHYGMLCRYVDSIAYLKEHDYLVCEDTANYLVNWCLNLEKEQKHDLMEQVAHQIICMQYMLELAKQLDCDPRAYLDRFLAKIQVAKSEFRTSFADALKQFKERIVRRASKELEEAEAEEEEQNSLAGILDPVEVFDSLPDELKQCFESENIVLLQETLSKMDEEDAQYYMKRCIDSGLWLPDEEGTESAPTGT